MEFEAYFDFIQRIYIPFRLFVKTVDGRSVSTVPLFLVTYALHTSYVMTAILHSRQLNEFNSEHMVMIVTASTYPIGLIISMSSFNVRVSFGGTEARAGSELDRSDQLSIELPILIQTSKL